MQMNRFKTKPYAHQLEGLRVARDREYFAYFCEMGTGKAQPKSCKVLTPTGWREIGGLRVGDDIFASDGSLTVVTGVYPQGIRPVFKVTMNDRASTLCCDEHLWMTQNTAERLNEFHGRHHKPMASVKSTAEIRKKLKDGAGNNIHSIPVSGQVSFPDRWTEIDPYLLGLLLGDGCIRKGVSISNPEKFILNQFRSLVGRNLKIVSRGIDHHVVTNNERKINWLRDELSRIGLLGKYSHEKFVPEDYLVNSKSKMISLLQGLMDTDGTVERGCATYSTTSPHLRDAVCFITGCLGGISRVSSRAGKYKKDGKVVECKTGYAVRINLPSDICPFRLPTKKNLFRPNQKYKPVRRFITDISPSNGADCVCISIEHPSRLYITDGFIVTHNTFVVINEAAQLHGEGKVDALIVFAPKGVHSNWVINELPKHMPDWVNYKAVAWKSGCGVKERKRIDSILTPEKDVLRVLAMNWDSIVYDSGMEFAKKFCSTARSLMIVADESQRIKNPTAQRTKSLMKLREHSKYRRIMSGSPVLNSPFDLYSQMSFLDPSILKTTSFYSFKTEYAEMLQPGNKLLQNIVKSKLKMSPQKRSKIVSMLSEAETIISANGRPKLIEGIEIVRSNFDDSDWEETIKSIESLVSEFGSSPSEKRARCKYLLSMAQQECMAEINKAKSILSNPRRLPQIVAKDKSGKKQYRNMDKLKELVDPHCFRAFKKDCLDLPPKIYKKIWYDMSPKQKIAYKKMKEEARIILSDQTEAPVNKLAVLMKLAQICSGFVIEPVTKRVVAIEESTPKLEILEERLEDSIEAGRSVIIWARFIEEHEQIAELCSKNGWEHAVYNGATTDDQRSEATRAFQNQDIKVMIAQQKAGGTGNTWTAASHVIYYSNDFSLENRVQSEDRAHRIGQNDHVVYEDLLGTASIEPNVLKALQDKQDIADILSGANALSLLDHSEEE